MFQTTLLQSLSDHLHGQQKHRERVCQEVTIRIVNLLCGMSTNWTGDALLQFSGELMPMYSYIGQCSLSEVTFAGLHLLYKH